MRTFGLVEADVNCKKVHVSIVYTVIDKNNGSILVVEFQVPLSYSHEHSCHLL
jgi:hypothetical protein